MSPTKEGLYEEIVPTVQIRNAEELSVAAFSTERCNPTDCKTRPLPRWGEVLVSLSSFPGRCPGLNSNALSGRGGGHGVTALPSWFFTSGETLFVLFVEESFNMSAPLPSRL
jgi:hypothetical protein